MSQYDTILYAMLTNKDKKYWTAKDFQSSFNKLSAEEKKEQVEQLKALPNFDKDIFYEISGIDIENTEPRKMTVAEVCKELGYEVEIVKGD